MRDIFLRVAITVSDFYHPFYNHTIKRIVTSLLFRLFIFHITKKISPQDFLFGTTPNNQFFIFAGETFYLKCRNYANFAIGRNIIQNLLQRLRQPLYHPVNSRLLYIITGLSSVYKICLKPWLCLRPCVAGRLGRKGKPPENGSRGQQDGGLYFAPFFCALTCGASGPAAERNRGGTRKRVLKIQKSPPR